MVRGISGGEKRRLRISCALVAAPSVLFMDEPTSGMLLLQLLVCADVLKELAALGTCAAATAMVIKARGRAPKPSKTILNGCRSRCSCCMVRDEPSGHLGYSGAYPMCISAPATQCHLGLPAQGRSGPSFPAGYCLANSLFA